MSIVIGIDLSLTSTGIAIIENGKVIRTVAIKSKGHKDDGVREKEARMTDIVGDVTREVSRHEPDLAVLEAPSFASKFGSPHERAGLWWMTVKALNDRRIPVALVSPKQRSKYGTGNGNALKPAVHKAVKENYGTPDLPIKTDDEADALIVAAMGSRHLGQPVELVLPDGALDAMVKVVWPK